uniref:Laminin EGF-like domain-containing protein n=1 Tax=Plectus sambesii TaxID=2011161 RepID=A0A914VQP3_9BILA
PTAGPDGRCQCKAYVTGPNCDQCIANSFHFSPANPQGCIPCFCSGVTQDCSSSSWYRHTEEVDFSRGGRNIFE